MELRIRMNWVFKLMNLLILMFNRKNLIKVGYIIVKGAIVIDMNLIMIICRIKLM